VPGQSCFSTTSLRVSSTSQEQRNFAAALTSDLESDGFDVVVDQRLGEETFVGVGPFGPLRDGFVLYLARLLAHLRSLSPDNLVIPQTSSIHSNADLFNFEQKLGGLQPLSF
jgi:hypothetical protein